MFLKESATKGKFFKYLLQHGNILKIKKIKNEI